MGLPIPPGSKEQRLIAADTAVSEAEVQLTIRQHTARFPLSPSLPRSERPKVARLNDNVAILSPIGHGSQLAKHNAIGKLDSTPRRK